MYSRIQTYSWKYCCNEKSKAAKNLFIANSPSDLFITDFALHSLGVFLFQRNKHETYRKFVKDVIIEIGIKVIGLDPEEVLALKSRRGSFWILIILTNMRLHRSTGLR